MSKINRVPYGVQDLLGNTAAGINPAELLQQVRPQLGLEPYWDFEKTKWETKNAAVSASSQGVFWLVPAGELWIPISVGGKIRGMGTGDTAALSIRVFEVSGGNGIPLSWTDRRTFARADEDLVVGYSFSRRQLYSQGRIIGVVLDDFASGAAKTINAAIQYVALKI